MSEYPAAQSRIGDRFVIEAEVGRGGVGVVYRAWDEVSARRVALKVVACEVGAAPKEEARLREEGRLLADLSHHGIVRIVAYGSLPDEGQPYVAMEWLEGEDLAARQRRDPLSLVHAMRLCIRVAEALGVAHAAGAVHRDIKPGNIFLCRTPDVETDGLGFTPKILDFGVAARLDLLSNEKDIVGTPAYMAPEQARGDARVDTRSDIYALGAVLFELVSGRPPHMGPSMIATLARLATTVPPRLSTLRRDTPRLLDALVQRMLETDPNARPASMQEVVEALEEALEETSPDTGRASWADLGEHPLSSRLGSSASRLITSIVAIRLEAGSARERALAQLRERGADATPLGSDAIVAHLGARQTAGTEATTALELGRRLARLGASVGIASGRARVNRGDPEREALPVGEVVDRASALARDAGMGVVLADTTTTELGRGRYELRSRQDGSAVVGEPLRGPPREGRGGAPFVGREAELAHVLSAFERSAEQATPILISISGPPGIGKSRLRREVMARITARASAPHIVLQRSEAYGQGQALGAAADIIRTIIGLAKGARAEEAQATLEARLNTSSLDLTLEQRQVLACLLGNEPLPGGLDPHGARDVLWLAMTELVLTTAASEPTALLLEDLQWADPESIGWLDHMLGRAADLPLLVMALVRPSFWALHRDRFSGRDHVRIDLRPISARAVRTIARSLLGAGASDDVVQRIADQAGGLPLFAEELARLTVAGRGADTAPSIETAIQASLDALDEQCRDAVGRLSVLGLTSWDSALEALGLRDAESVMRALAGAEVLMEQEGSRFPGTREWLFKHALVREVAYASLGQRERVELHALAAAWLASMGEDAAMVAGHYDLGGQPTLAAEYWARAAQRALAANALADALRMAERALTFAEDKVTGFQRARCLDEAFSRLDPRASDRESAMIAMEENVHDEASELYARGARTRYDDARGLGERVNERLSEVRDRAEVLGLYDEEARSSAVLASRLAFAGEFAAAEAEVRRLIRLAEEHRILGAAVDAYQTQAIIRQTQGALSAALAARRNAASAARNAGLREREAMLVTNIGFALTTIGARKEARAALESGLALADAIGSSGAVRHARMNLLGWAATFGNDKGLEAILAETRADADRAASGMWAASDRANLGVLFYRGAELLRQQSEGADRRAVALLSLSAQAYRTTGNTDILPVALARWAQAEQQCGNVERALGLATEAASMLAQGAPTLLNESAIYLALHAVHVFRQDDDAARDAVAAAMRPLRRRLLGLVGTPYARQFLAELPDNAALLALAEGYGLVPEEVQVLLERSAS